MSIFKPRNNNTPSLFPETESAEKTQSEAAKINIEPTDAIEQPSIEQASIEQPNQDNVAAFTVESLGLLEDNPQKILSAAGEIKYDADVIEETDLAHVETDMQDGSASENLSAESDNSPPPPPALTGDGFGSDDDGETAQIALYAENAYLSYAMSMVKGRALPYCQDGQKPVQRRILYSMHQLGLTHTSKPVKSARVVGDVLGKFHPHGDSSAYDAAVRLSQDFKLRYPLIDGQGNFGSRDGDSAAAMRYTEMRLTRFSELLLSEINQGTVDFRDNYDAAFQEPCLLPARLPILLMNGSEGIAVGMATKIPPHQLNEVTEAAILAMKGKATFENVMEHIQGPDFPEGGHIISSREEILEAYRTGSGSVRARCRWEVESLARGQYRIIITELPYDISSNRVMTEIDQISSPQIKVGKKTLDAEQLAMKQTLLSMLDYIHNESGKSVRIVIDPKSSKVDPNELMNFLMANTSLEESFSINMTMVGLDGRPTRKNVLELLQEWAEFRFTTVTRRSRFLLDKCQARLHILEGRMIAFIHIDEVIRVIKESDEPKERLMEAFKLSDIQAEDILEIRLRQLARLEGIKIDNEMKSLHEEADTLKNLLANEGDMRALIIKEMREDMKKYGDVRRTLVEPVERAKRSAVSQLINSEPVTILLSKQGWIRSRLGHGLDLTNLSHKPADSTWFKIETNTTHPVVFLDNAGRSYSILAHTIPGGKGEGVPVTTLVDLQKDLEGKATKIVHMLSDASDAYYLFATDDGYGFTAQLSGLIARNKAGKAFMEPVGSTKILAPMAIGDNDLVVAVSSEFKMLAFPLAELKERANGGKGVMVMDLAEGVTINQLALSKLELPEVTVTNKKGKPQSFNKDKLEHYVGKRARKGYLLN